MPWRCKEEFTQKLLEAPESGMGYQLISFGETQEPTHLVLGSQLVVALNEDFNFEEWSFRGQPDENLAVKLSSLESFSKEGRINVFPGSFNQLIGLFII